MEKQLSMKTSVMQTLVKNGQIGKTLRQKRPKHQKLLYPARVIPTRSTTIARNVNLSAHQGKL